MTWVLVASAAALALLVAGLAWLVWRLRARVVELERRHAASSHAHGMETAAPSPPSASPDGASPEFVITELGAEEPRAPVPTVEARLFGDLVLRETVVQAASWAHGVRRALTPESRNRIRFEMKREVKRARKQRRADLRQARREWEDRQRAGIDLQDLDDLDDPVSAEDSAA